MSSRNVLLLALTALGILGMGSEEARPAGGPVAPVLRPESPPEDAAPARASSFTLEDQFGDAHDYTFPKTKVSVLIFADKGGSEQVEGWVLPLYDHYRDAIDIDGVADLSAVPSLMRGVVRFFFKRNADRPIMLDWDGTVTTEFACTPGRANVFVVDPEGIVVYRCAGGAEPQIMEKVRLAVDRAVDSARAVSLPDSPGPVEPSEKTRGSSDSS